MKQLPRSKLHELVLRYGRAVCDEPRRCKSLLLDTCGEYRTEINVLITALEVGVPRSLAANSASWEQRSTSLVNELISQTAMEEGAARWAVDAWGVALGIVKADHIGPDDSRAKEKRPKAAKPASLPSFDPRPRQQLHLLIARYGPALVYNQVLCKDVLLQVCPPGSLETRLLVMALEQRVGLELLAPPKGVSQEVVIHRAAHGLRSSYALDRHAAEWAVRSWALALGLADEPHPAEPAEPSVTTLATAPSATSSWTAVPMDDLRPNPAPIVDRSQSIKRLRFQPVPPPILLENLRQLVERDGRSFYGDPRRCRALLLDSVGEYRGEIEVLVFAVEDGTVDRLLADRERRSVLATLVPHLAEQLQDRLALPIAVCRWAVETWALAFRLGPETLGLVPTAVSPAVQAVTSDTEAVSPPLPPAPPSSPSLFRPAPPASSGVAAAAIAIGIVILILGVIVATLSYYQPRVVSLQVQANQGWQNTGIQLRARDQVLVEYVSGAWTYWVGHFAPYDGNGPPNEKYVCASIMEARLCHEAVPDFKKGALVGRLGPWVFGVGNRGEFIAQEDGWLELRMNDEDGGLFDNAGSVVVRITVQHK